MSNVRHLKTIHSEIVVTIAIGTTEFYFGSPKLESYELKNYSEEVFENWAKKIDETLAIQDFAISLEIEDGSIKGKGKIAAAATFLYFGIAQYGSFISGIQTIKSQTSIASEFLIQTAEKHIAQPTGVKRSRKTSDAVGSLEYLFRKVQRGELTPAEATIKAEAILVAYGDAPRELIDELEKSFVEAPTYHKQLLLPLSEEPLPESLRITTKRENKNHQPSEPSRFPSDQFRVEIWRESRREPKNVRVVKL